MMIKKSADSVKKPARRHLKTIRILSKISEQEYFDHGVVMVAMVKAGVELAFETMIDARDHCGIRLCYESLHELPLIANTIARKRLYEMNVVISRYRRIRQLPVLLCSSAVTERLYGITAAG